jgi:hypothetical protein
LKKRSFSNAGAEAVERAAVWPQQLFVYVGGIVFVSRARCGVVEGGRDGEGSGERLDRGVRVESVRG